MAIAEPCGLTEASCACVEDAGHAGPHVCSCRGSWDFSASGDFIFVSAPEQHVGPLCERCGIFPATNQGLCDQCMEQARRDFTL